MAQLKSTNVTGNLAVTGNINGGKLLENGNAIATQEWVGAQGYLPKSGGKLTGPTYFDSASGNNKTNNYLSAGGGFSTGSGRLGLKLVALDQSDAQMGMGVDLTGGSYELTVATGRSSDTGISKIVFATHTTGTTAYKPLATLISSAAATPTATFNVNGTIQESGTALSSKYLGINAKASSATVADSANAVAWSNVSGKPSSYYTLPKATDSALGGVKTGYTAGTVSGTSYTAPVELNSSNQAFVTIPKAGITGALGYTPANSDNVKTYSAATTSALGLVKLGFTTSGKNYAVQINNQNNLFVNVPWTDTTYSNATTSAAGLMSAADKTKLDGIASSANNFSLPTRLAAGTTTGGASNDATEQGWYYIARGDANRPPFLNVVEVDTGTDYRVMTNAHSASWLQQIATNFRSNDIFIRRRQSGTWMGWTSLVKMEEGLANPTGTANAVPRWHGSVNSTLKDSKVTIDDNGVLNALTLKENGTSLSDKYTTLSTAQTISGAKTFSSKITQGNPSSDATIVNMNRFEADLFVAGNGSMATNNPKVAGFYLGKSQGNDANRHMDIVSGGDYSYIDFNKASVNSDYQARLLVNVSTGYTEWCWNASSKIFSFTGGTVRANSFVENGIALSDKYQAKGSGGSGMATVAYDVELSDGDSIDLKPYINEGYKIFKGFIQTNDQVDETIIINVNGNRFTFSDDFLAHHIEIIRFSDYNGGNHSIMFQGSYGNTTGWAQASGSNFYITYSLSDGGSVSASITLYAFK